MKYAPLCSAPFRSTSSIMMVYSSFASTLDAAPSPAREKHLRIHRSRIARKHVQIVHARLSTAQSPRLESIEHLVRHRLHRRLGERIGAAAKNAARVDVFKINPRRRRNRRHVQQTRFYPRRLRISHQHRYQSTRDDVRRHRFTANVRSFPSAVRSNVVAYTPALLNTASTSPCSLSTSSTNPFAPSTVDRSRTSPRTDADEPRARAALHRLDRALDAVEVSSVHDDVAPALDASTGGVQTDPIGGAGDERDAERGHRHRRASMSDARRFVASVSNDDVRGRRIDLVRAHVAPSERTDDDDDDDERDVLGERARGARGRRAVAG